MARVTVDGDTVRLRPGWAMLGVTGVLYGLPTVVLGLIGLVCLAHGGTAYLGVGVGLIVVAAASAILVWRLHFWDEAVEATAVELRVRRRGAVIGRVERERLGATAFVIGSYGSTGKHRLKVYSRDGEELDAWPLRFGYDGLQTRPFYQASGVPDAQLLRDRAQDHR